MGADRYDVVFTKSSVAYNFMLRQEGRTKDWLVTDAPLLPQTLITESASPSNINPQREIQISQVDWRKGFQDEILDDEHKYYESENCDARFKGEVTLSPKKLSAISFGTTPTAPTLTDGELDTWTDANDLTNWTEAGDCLSSSWWRSDVNIRHTASGYSGKYGSSSSNSGGDYDGSIYQQVWSSPNLPSSYQGKIIRVSAWAYGYDSAGPKCRIVVYDGVDTTTGDDIITSSETWQQGTVEHTFNASADELKITIEFATSSNANYAYVDDVTIDDYPLYGAIAKQIEFGDDIVVASGNTLFNTASGSAVYLYNFPETITDLCVFENNLYIALGWSDEYWYTSDLSTFTESTFQGGITDNVTATTSAYSASATAIDVVDSSVFSAAGVYAQWGDEVIEVDAIVDADTITAIRAQEETTAAYHASGTDITEIESITGAKYMSNVGGSQFWISDTNSTMRVSTNPVNDGDPFSTAYQVDSDDWDITGLVDHPDTVFCRKEDNLYYLSGADVIELIPSLKAESSTTYTYGLYLWKGSLYIGAGTNSLYEYNASTGTTTTISPVRYAIGDGDYDEDVIAMCGDETYLYIAIDNGSDIKILAGRWETVDGNTDWRWHPLYDLTMNDITSMLISSASGSKRLYVGTDTYTDGIIPFFIPVGYSQIYTESGFKCQASGNFYFSKYQTNFPTEDKYFKSVDITTKLITDKTSATLYYWKKGDTDWTSLGACTTSTDPGGGAYPTEVTTSFDIDQTAAWIQYKLAMAAADDDYTPILYGTGGGIVAYAILEPTEKRQIVATIQVAPQIRLRDGDTEEKVVSTELTNLRALYTGGGTMTLVGPDATSYTVSFARDGYQEQLGYDESMQQEVYWCTCRLLED